MGIKASTRRNAANTATEAPQQPRGLPLSPDAMLTALGVFRDPDTGQLVREIELPTGEIEIVDGEEYLTVEIIKRPVAPPGMTVKEAREQRLDFYDPSMGWLREARKREIEHPDNLGSMVTQRRLKRVKRREYDAKGEAE